MSGVEFSFEFRPVGQGLFSTGRLLHKNRTFNWVYDCGSSSSGAALDREIDAYATSLDDADDIDLFIISHLDLDHINGFSKLVKRKRVKRLVLPYFPLYERILIALSQPVVSPSSLRLAIDPVGYISELSDGSLVEIIFIVGDSEGPVPVHFDEEPSDEGPTIDHEDPIKFHSTEKPQYDLDIPIVENNRINSVYASSGKTAKILEIWEFVFYNQKYSGDRMLSADVKKIIDKAPKTEGYFDSSEDIIHELKKLYETKFTTAYQRNNISLVVYAGPNLYERSIISEPFLFQSWHYYKILSLLYKRPFLRQSNEEASLLYFGDIKLGKRNLKEIKNHIGAERWKQISVVQIAHHGAKGSWYKGAASEFSHLYSVYSYGLHNTYKHPGKEVVEDFSKMSTTVLVNEYQGASWDGWLQHY